MMDFKQWFDVINASDKMTKRLATQEKCKYRPTNSRRIKNKIKNKRKSK